MCFRLVLFFKQDLQICVVAYKMFWYLRMRLTEIKAIDVRVSTHCKVISYIVLFIICNVIKNENRIWKCLARWNDVAVIGKCKITNVSINFSNINILVVTMISTLTRTCSQSVCRKDFLTSLSIFAAFDGPHIISRIEISSIVYPFFKH